MIRPPAAKRGPEIGEKGEGVGRNRAILGSKPGGGLLEFREK